MGKSYTDQQQITLKNISFPVQLIFKISSLANDFNAIDANGRSLAYVRQKMFKLKEDIEIYNDESRTALNYRIQANKWLDFSTTYQFLDRRGDHFGRVARKGWASVWKAKYEIIDQNDQLQYHISEDNAWIKFTDSTVGEIPVIGFFTGYIFNPTYSVSKKDGTVIAQLKKEPSFWGRKFTIEKVGEFDEDDAERIMLSLMMMILLERRRG